MSLAALYLAGLLLIEALDAERLAIARAFGLAVRTIHEHFHLSFDVPMGPPAEMTQALAQRPTDVKGPTTLDSRYVTEDVPFGLVPTIRLAALAGVPVPLSREMLAGQPV